MPITIQPNETIKLTSSIVDYDEDTGVEIPVQASSYTGTILKWDGDSYEPHDTFTPSDLTVGTVYYDWVPTSTGKYKITFTATLINTNTVSDIRIFYVGTISTTKTLAANHVTYFMPALDPLFVDPTEVLNYYKDGDLIEITEKIHRYSNVVLSLLKVTDLTEVTPLIHDYILASVLCELSRIYAFDGGLSGFSKADSFTLGDLQVRSESSNKTGGTTADAGNATTWCELAALFREQLTRTASSPRSFVKSYGWESPIPVRALRRFD